MLNPRWAVTVLVAALLSTAANSAAEPLERGKIKLYALDGGTLDVSDMASFSDTGTFDGEAVSLVNPSFLIRHPKGDLLWDTGYGDALAKLPEGSKNGVWHSKLKTPVVEQLGRLGLDPSDIEYLSLSHLHPDHSGNANLFSGSTFIVHRLERAYMFSEEMMAAFGESYSELEDAKTVQFEGRYDVFGDGTVIIFETPGHTPGSSVLLVRLQGAGNILLTGDLYTHNRGRSLGTVPQFNLDKKQTLESRRVFENLVKQERARVVIQHSKTDFNVLPVFPKFLD